MENDKNRLQLGSITVNKYGENSIHTLNNKIVNYTRLIYSPFGMPINNEDKRDIDIDVDGNIINTEYLSKLVNNYTIFKKVISYFNIKTESEFYSFIENNLKEIYHYKSDFFNKESLPIVINSSRKGNIGEQKSFNFFEYEIFRKTNVDIKIEKPTIIEDLSGIDGKFLWKGKTLTIQVKPFQNYTKSDSDIKFYSVGSLSLSTDYLILYKMYPVTKYVIVKSRDVEINGNYFILDQNSIINK